ncbi:Putative fluoride ion transporter CrcB [Bacillus rhizoplanae]|uniref:Fluoride-specific ion channel FluC n=1 Tax=Bacillus rhizoplanae TaxID=2880966 RepID=A0ABM8Y5E9_9BACI|nr:fluoride efflux transporter CrcB [Bacillus rhizoplanae]CAG9610873.1 Putative fluoride ion transporter CrcB [Bacillus rhizoplanae]
MKKYIAVGIGGIIGALARYGVGQLLEPTSFAVFPLATWLANMSGSFLLAFLTMSVFRMKQVSPLMISAVGTGIIGSFTTFSTFSVDTLKLLQHEAFTMAFLYVSASMIGGLFFAFGGFYVGNVLYERGMRKEGNI